MSTAARPALAIRAVPATRWAPWVIFAADVPAIEIAFLIGLAVRRLVAPWFPMGVGPDSIWAWRRVSAAADGPLSDRPLSRLYAGAGGAAAEAGARDHGGVRRAGGVGQPGGARVFSRGVLLATLLFALLLTPLAEMGALDPDPPGALGYSGRDARRGRYGARGGPHSDSGAATGAQADRVSGQSRDGLELGGRRNSGDGRLGWRRIWRAARKWRSFPWRT